MTLGEVLSQMRADLKKIAKECIDADEIQAAQLALVASTSIAEVRNECESDALDVEFVPADRGDDL